MPGKRGLPPSHPPVDGRVVGGGHQPVPGVIRQLPMLRPIAGLGDFNHVPRRVLGHVRGRRVDLRQLVHGVVVAGLVD